MKQFEVTEIRIITQDYTYTSHATHTVLRDAVYAVGDDGWYIYSPPFERHSVRAVTDWPEKEQGKITLFRDYWKYLLDPDKPEDKSSPHDNAYKKAPYKVIV